MRSLVAVTVALALASTTAPPSAAGPDAPELAIGDWFGSARAGGVTSTSGEGLTIVGDADFTVTFEFIVPIDGPVTGTWTLRGSSVFDFFGEVDFRLTWASHVAEGQIVGDRRRLSLGITQIHSVGLVNLPGLPQNVTSSDRLGPLDLAVSGVLCDDAWGEWIMSWNTVLEGEGYTPTFRGDWHAIRQDPEFTEPRIVSDLASDHQQLSYVIRDVFESSHGELTTSFLDEIWNLLLDAVEVLNEVRNLSPCDQAVLGDRVEEWIYGWTQNVGVLATKFLEDSFESQQLTAPETLLYLATILAGTGAIGEGSLFEGASHLEDLLDRAVVENLDRVDPSSEDELAAIFAAAEQMGWEFEAPEGAEE
jgi:hypothetical protein